MGRNHARVISESDRAQLAVVVDPVEQVGKALADQHIAPWRPDLDELDDVDAVVIAASTEHHYGIAMHVIRAGKPLLVEKPVCPSLEQTAEVLSAAERGGVPIMCGLLERFNPAVLTARRMIRDPLYIRADRHSPYAPRIKTGVAWDLLVHDVDLITQLFGGVDPQSVRADLGFFHPGSAADAEDVAEVGMRFANGVGTASASRLGQRKLRAMTVQMLDAMVEIDLLRRGVTLYRHTTINEDVPGGAGFRQVTEMEVPEVTGREPLSSQLDRFLDLVDGTVDADEERVSILPAHRIIEAATRAKTLSAAV